METYSPHDIAQDSIWREISTCDKCNNLFTFPIRLVNKKGDICNLCYKSEEMKNTIALQNYPLEKILSAIKVECAFLEYGCTETSIPFVKTRHHIEKCNYRRIPCPEFITCPWYGALAKLPNHLKGAHPERVSVTIREKINFVFEPEEIVNRRIMLFENKVFTIIFHIKREQLNDDLFYSIYLVPSNYRRSYMMPCCPQQFLIRTRKNSMVLKPVCTGQPLHKFLAADAKFVKVDMSEFRRIFHNLDGIEISIEDANPPTAMEIYRNTLQGFFSCPMCKNIMRPPISMCLNGHSICILCSTKADACHECYQPYEARNFALEALLIPNVEYKCKFQCGKSGSHRELTQHELTCTFSVTECPIDDCEYSGTYSTFLNEHMKNKHPDVSISKISEFNSCFKLDSVGQNHYVGFLYEENFFLLTLSMMDDRCTWIVEAVIVADRDCVYIFTVSIYDNKHEKKLSKRNECWNAETQRYEAISTLYEEIEPWKDAEGKVNYKCIITKFGQTDC